MTQRYKSAHNRLKKRTQSLTNKRFASSLPAQTLSWLSSVSLLSGGFVFAQAESGVDNIVPTIESSQPTAVTEADKKDSSTPEPVKSTPDFSERRSRLKQKLNNKEVSQTAEDVKKSQPQAETSEVKKPEKALETAKPANNNHAGDTDSATGRKTKDYNNAEIDPTEYTNTATNNYEPPHSVVVTERSTGCEAVFSKKEISAGVCGKKANDNPSVANAAKKSAPSWIKTSETTTLAKTPKTLLVGTKHNSETQNVVKTVAAAINNNQTWGTFQSRTNNNTTTTYRSNRFIPQPSEVAPTTTVSATPIAPSFGSLPAPISGDNLAPRPSNVSYDFALASVLPQVPYSDTFAYAYRGSSSGVAFPLSFAAPITSLFGWRIHPITGDRRFHAGTDIGAPTGTPILAAAKGQVETADWIAGYGLTVIINHSSAQQTLYGHMSDILVRPGQWVEPGTMIGRVGSTGNSTGAHLHFEVRHLSPNGWVAVDPSVKLHAGLNNLLYSNRTAQAR